ncbi:hypothetical protein R1sor_003495 [Riccia sorocarpa]|uniref:Leucine-rich repeat-containing N-terminal plant-type domain-containing protein n=1 Tax=Riccia sorocarpa TaxID=122646 RepID=A0ABD3H1R8_9MARC
MVMSSFFGFRPSWVVVICIVSLSVLRCASAQQCDPGDSRALLDFKAAFTDPGGLFNSWQPGTNCCTWRGVNCTSSGRVQALQPLAPFPGRGPSPERNPTYGGVVGASLANLTELLVLNLDYVQFNGPIPDSLGQLKKLEDLSLFLNNFTGPLPPSLGGATSLKNLLIDIYGPNFIAPVTPAPIPSSYCALVNLRTLTLRFKTTGTIPACFCKLTQLTILNLNSNNLVGAIPNCIGTSLTQLEQLDLGFNSFTGSIPLTLTSLTKLQFLNLEHNKFSGSIPSQIGNNLVNLVRLNLGSNSLTGPIPSSFGRLTKLEVLVLSFNFLTRIAPELGNLVNLQNLFLDSNRLQGNLPPELGKAGSAAQFGFTFNVSNNGLRGPIPDVCSTGASRSFYAANNFFTGGFPLSLALCSIVDVSNNRLSDPSQIGTVPSNPPVQELRLGNNRFPSGPIPAWLTSLISAGSQTLQVIDISSNSFTGPVPDVIFNLPSVSRLNISRNAFNSVLPTAVTFAPGVRLTGPLPPNSGDFQELFYLDLKNNALTGTVPASVAAIPTLLYLDLSNNQFTGDVPSKRPPPGQEFPP